MYVNVDRLDYPASPRHLPQQYEESLQHTIASHRGSIIEFDKPEILVLFPAAILPHYHATQAVVTALEIVRQTHNFNQLHTATSATKFRVSIGLDTAAPAAVDKSAAPAPGSDYDETIVRHLSELNRQTPFPAAFLSANTYHTLKGHHAWHIENLGYTFPSPAHARLQVYAVMPSFN